MEIKKLLKHLWLVMFITIGFTLTSCSDDNDVVTEEEKEEDSALIYGSWKYTFGNAGYQLISFHQDGKYVLQEIDDNGGHWMEHGYFKLDGDELILDNDDDDEVEDKSKYKIHKLTSSLLGIQLTHIYSYGKWISVSEGSKDEKIELFKRVN